jgi:hypothetical protein
MRIVCLRAHLAEDVEAAGGADAIQIRPVAYISLTSTTALDDHQTNSRLARFAETLENWPQ